MRLLIISHSCATPVNQQIYAEVERLTGWDLTLVVPSNWKSEYGKTIGGGRWPSFNGRIIPVPVWLSGNIVLHAYKTSFSRMIKDVGPDVIYVNHEPYAVATAQVFQANRRTLRRPIGFYSCQNLYKQYPVPFRWTESMVLHQSSFFFPISSAVDAVFRKKGYAARSTVLPLGIDPGMYHPRPEGADLKKQLRANPDEVLIGYVGRIVAEKGLATLLKAMGLIRALPWRLIVVGSGPFEADFDAMAKKLGLMDRIVRVGHVPHEKAPAYLSAFDLLVLPSETQANWKEQFGRVVIEAMACGTAVAGSDSGEIPRLINDTQGGVVFRERDPQDMARQLSTLIQDRALRERLASEGMRTVNQQYALPAIAESFAAAVGSVVPSLDAAHAAG